MRALLIAALFAPIAASADEPILRVARATAANRARFAAGDDPIATRERWGEHAGADAFALFPVGVDATWELAIGDDARLRSLGVELRDGEAIGLVFVEDAGVWRSGYSCALCHGRSRPGRANATLDYGRLYADAFPDHPEASRWRGWGPGRVDVTDDGVDDPLRIPDLIALHQVGSLQVSGAHHYLHGRLDELLGRSPVAAGVKPGVSVALESWLRGLPSPPAPNPNLAGAAPFRTHCAGCHDGPALGGTKVIDAAEVGTDARAARDVLRGTGSYRVPPLLGVGSRARLFHDGSAATIGDVLDPKRTSPGHPWGRTLPEGTRAAIAAYLASSRFNL
jgi:mono/diheme cytochrome c family protein